MFESDSIY